MLGIGGVSGRERSSASGLDVSVFLPSLREYESCATMRCSALRVLSSGVTSSGSNLLKHGFPWVSGASVDVLVLWTGEILKN
jgi:hypothetical protein